MRRRLINLSWDLDEKLKASAERIAQSILTGREIKQYIKFTPRTKGPVEPVPDDVAEWFEETEDYEDE